MLILKMIVLGAEFDSLTDGATFNAGYPSKSGSYGQKQNLMSRCLIHVRK